MPLASDRRLLLTATLLLAGCALPPGSLRWTEVKKGMTEPEVSARLGPPYWGSPSEWRYCETRQDSDLIIAFFFGDGRVKERVSYRIHPVSSDDTTGARVGTCMDNLANQGPSWVQRIRKKMTP